MAINGAYVIRANDWVEAQEVFSGLKNGWQNEGARGQWSVQREERGSLITAIHSDYLTQVTDQDFAQVKDVAPMRRKIKLKRGETLPFPFPKAAVIDLT